MSFSNVSINELWEAPSQLPNHFVNLGLKRQHLIIDRIETLHQEIRCISQFFRCNSNLYHLFFLHCVYFPVALVSGRRLAFEGFSNFLISLLNSISTVKLTRMPSITWEVSLKDGIHVILKCFNNEALEKAPSQLPVFINL